MRNPSIGIVQSSSAWGHLPGIPFNEALDRILESVVSPFTSKQLTRKEIYITQACHFLPREGRRRQVPVELMELSVRKVTRHEVKGRRVIALGGEAQAAL